MAGFLTVRLYLHRKNLDESCFWLGITWSRLTLCNSLLSVRSCGRWFLMLYEPLSQGSP